MYVIRSALRASTARPPARIIRRRRYPSSARLRTLHTTRPLFQAPNPPQTPDSAPADPNGVNNPHREKTSAQGSPDAAVAQEDPDLLAQKLQRSRETYRRYSAALRRQQRGKKTQGLPPLHIPEWFLKQRVIRHKDLGHERDHLRPRPILSVAVKHAESGEHATCAIPTGRNVNPADNLSRLTRCLWNTGLEESEKRKVEEYFEDRVRGLDKATSEDKIDAKTKAPASVDPASTKPIAKASVVSEDASFNQAWSKMNDILKENKKHYPDKAEAIKRLSNKLERVAKRREIAESWKSGTWKDLSCLVSAEIKANIAASLATVQPNTSSSFPSAKTNLILHSPTFEHESAVDDCIQATAFELGSDLMVLTAQDLARLAGDYLGEGQEPSPRSVRSLGYETYRLSAGLPTAFEQTEEAADEDAEFGQSSSGRSDSVGNRHTSATAFVLPNIRSLFQVLQQGTTSWDQTNPSTSSLNEEPDRTQSQSELQLEDMKLAALLEALIDLNDIKRQHEMASNGKAQTPQHSKPSASKAPAFFDYSLTGAGTELELKSPLPANANFGLSVMMKASSTSKIPRIPKSSKIIFVKDFKELNATHYGGRIIQKLEELVRKRRESGESVMIIGSTCSRDLTPELSASGVHGLQTEGESSLFRTIVLASETSSGEMSFDEIQATAETEIASLEYSSIEKEKSRRINLVHIQEMLRCLDPSAAIPMTDLEHSDQKFQPWASIFSHSSLSRILTYDEVHRIALTALGLHIWGSMTEAETPEDLRAPLNWAHIALAIGFLKASDVAKYTHFTREAENSYKSQASTASHEAQKDGESTEKKRLEEVRKVRQRRLQDVLDKASKYEKRLAPGIIDPDQIKTTFDQVHVPTETKDSIRTMTSLSLLRPEAFSYGILATEKISGALLYGPPGTGKTLLAKAVAKESGSTVLEVSGSQIMDKYVGEGEKNVAAIFSLSKKLSPCIVFLDEADAVFASRDAMRERASHRDILNQFLKEWDGLNDISVFVMVATNRPFDLDDAVIRRLPRRLLVDLPTQADREEILKIHLRGEELDALVDLKDLAKRTPFYSGSDLKNVAISAALACVKEENEEAARTAAIAAPTQEQSTASTAFTAPKATVTPTLTPTLTPAPTPAVDSKTDKSAATPNSTSTNPPLPPPPSVLHLVPGQAYTFPEKRILQARHFDASLQEISASISEDMSSLSAIKKFDEQYGGRRGNKRKKDFGFAMLTVANENAARVRV